MCRARGSSCRALRRAASELISLMTFGPREIVARCRAASALLLLLLISFVPSASCARAFERVIVMLRLCVCACVCASERARDVIRTRFSLCSRLLACTMSGCAHTHIEQTRTPICASVRAEWCTYIWLLMWTTRVVQRRANELNTSRCLPRRFSRAR